jgi:hypothetical protein
VPEVIRLSEKYLQKVDAFASVADFDRWADTFTSPEFNALSEMVAQLHHEHLGQDDATSLLIDGFIEYCHLGGESLVEDAAKRKQLVTSLVTLIESYPRKYIFRVSLPSFPAYVDQEIEISPDVCLQMRKREQAGDQGSDSETWLRIKCNGYGSSDLESPIVTTALSIIKQCNFVLKSLEVARVAWASDRHAQAVLHDEHSGVAYAISIPATLSKHLAQLIPNEDKLTAHEPGLLNLLDFNVRPAKDDEERGAAIAAAVRPGLSKLFSIRAHPDFERLAAAIDWHEDSIHSDNQTVAYLAACIGMEAILGDSDSIQEMSARLADRLAFRMGGDREDRQRLWKRYKAILSVRGDLVHAKAARLTSENRRLLWDARDLLHNLIWHELKTLYKQAEKTEAQSR